jgi:3-hydroxyacyl-CoA dehydrogenase
MVLTKERRSEINAKYYQKKKEQGFYQKYDDHRKAYYQANKEKIRAQYQAKKQAAQVEQVVSDIVDQVALESN